MSYMKEEWLKQEEKRQEEILRLRSLLMDLDRAPELKRPRLTEGMWAPPIRTEVGLYAPPPGASAPRHTVLEGDKPEGTRDVEKFLREQQDAIWRND